MFCFGFITKRRTALQIVYSRILPTPDLTSNPEVTNEQDSTPTSITSLHGEAVRLMDDFTFSFTELGFKWVRMWCSRELS
jgi:hypothetical protein